jgi:hypothetical protein
MRRIRRLGRFRCRGMDDKTEEGALLGQDDIRIANLLGTADSSGLKPPSE